MAPSAAPAAWAQLVACYGLPDAQVPSSSDAPDEHEWATLLAWCRSARMLGLLDAAHRADEIHLRANHADDLEHAVMRARERVRPLRAGAAEAAETLGRAGIEVRAFKGFALDGLAYPSDLRLYADVDLLVRRDALEDSLVVLARAGWLPTYAHPRPKQARRAAKAHDLGKVGAAIDVHRMIAGSPVGERIGDGGFEIGCAVHGGAEASVPALSEGGLGVAAALDLLLSARGSKPWAARDCLQLVSGGRGDDIRSVAQHWGVEGIVAAGLIVAGTRLGQPQLVPAWASELQLHPRDARLVRRFRGGRSLPLHLEIVRQLPSWRTRIDYARLVTPTPTSIQRAGGWRTVLRRELPTLEQRMP